MIFPLQARGRAGPGLARPVLGRVARAPREAAERGDWILVRDRLGEGADLAGYAGLLIAETVDEAGQAFLAGLGVPAIDGARDLSHLAAGDVVALHPSGYARTLYRRASPHNALFATDMCNSWCLMCSQPPKPVDDRDRLAEHLRLIELIDPATRELGITGGEPTLLGEGLLRIVERCRDRLPATSLHVLSNGRLFRYDSFARELAALGHPDLMIGIPLYSDLDSEHDYVVQARGAFDETMLGLHNLGRYRVPVEVRVVLHRLTFQRLPALAEFIYRNLTFTAHVALMGLEPMGFAVANWSELWIDPFDYRRQLAEATLFLAARGMNVSIYNHQLCVVPRELWPYCRRSISDWKNDYLPVCASCAVRDRCGGFFTSSASRRRYSSHISPVAKAI
jgi:His-Xaa-Ser system radical SAM maturase HxsC